ncbi:uncharacterized protein LOC135217483 isoform X1 [Macrobrachium nipponense]|uniref:uncharacterized protein LOC135217483 isoform X1 n=1 Tax=Macrobrachium nipponense TaxID=159736 RepID=UPI0030C88CB0
MSQETPNNGGKSGNIGPGDDKRHTDRRSERQSERRSEKQVDGQTSTQKSPTRVNRAANNTETSGLVTYEEVTVLCMKFATSSRFDIVD